MSGSFVLTDTTQSEGDFGPITSQFLVTRTGPVDQAWTGYWTVSPTGPNPVGLDDFAGSAFPSGVVTFAAGARSAVITMIRRGDTVVEPDETFRLDLAATLGGTPIASAVITIRDDEGWYRDNVETSSVREGEDQVFTFTRGLSVDAVTLSWEIAAPGSLNVASAADFGATDAFPRGTVTFAVGETSKQIVVRPIVDGRLEGTQSYELRVTGIPESAGFTSLTRIGMTITDAEVGVSIAAQQTSLVEGQPGGGTPFLFQVTRAGGSGTESVDWAVTGSGASPANQADFVGGVLPSGRITFAEGETTRTIEVMVLRDAIVEATEAFTVALSNPTAGLVITTGSATSSIANDDTPGIFSITSMQGAKLEGQSGTTTFEFLISRENASSVSHDVGWRVVLQDGGEVTPEDFAAGPLSGTIRFAPSEQSRLISLAVRGDTIIEFDEYIGVEIFAIDDDPNVQFTASLADATILNDDILYVVATDQPIVAEGQSGLTPFTFTVTRDSSSLPSEDVAWRVVLPGNPPLTAADFEATSLTGTLSFAEGESSGSFTINVAGDRLVEADEQFRVDLLATGGSAPQGPVLSSTTATIRNDDVSFSIQSAAVQQAEGNGGATPFTFTVTRAGLVPGIASVAWSVAGNSNFAADAADFVGGVLPSGILDFQDGELTKTVTIAVAGDRLAERAERFAVTLSPTNADGAIGNASAIGVILADDTTVSVAALLAARPEGNSGTTPFTFAVTRSGVTDAAQSVDWSVIGAGPRRATESDFAGAILPTGRVEFAAGETRKNITIEVAGDTQTEFDEGFAVLLANPTGGLVIDQAQALGTIIRDETRIGITADMAEVVEGTGGVTPVTFTVTRSGYTGAAKVVDWALVSSGPTRTVAGDFAPVALPRGALRFEAGEETKTITINLAADRLGEADETFTIRLGGRGEGVTLNPPVASVTILDDDTSVAIAPLLATQAEGDDGTTPFTFAVTRSGLLDATQSVSWSVLPQGNARASATDFAGGVLPSGVVTFDPGQASAIITVAVLGDGAVERAEDFAVRLSAPSPDLFISRASANGRILDDDSPGAASVVAQDWVL